jgi:hypothetical protein
MLDMLVNTDDVTQPLWQTESTNLFYPVIGQCVCGESMRISL